MSSIFVRKSNGGVRSVFLKPLIDNFLSSKIKFSKLFSVFQFQLNKKFKIPQINENNE